MKKRFLFTILAVLLFASVIAYADQVNADEYDEGYDVTEENTEDDVCPPHEWHYLDEGDIPEATFTRDEIVGVWLCEKCGERKSEAVRYFKVSNVKLTATQFTYNGKSQKPKVIVQDRKKKNLKLNEDYTLKYSKDTKSIGKHTVSVVLKGHYRGTKTLTYTIIPAGTKIKRITGIKKGFSVSWNKNSQASGYQIQYAENGKMTKGKTITTGSKTFSKTVRNLKAKKKYYVRVRTYKTVSGKRYYSAWSAIKTVKTK